MEFVVISRSEIADFFVVASDSEKGTSYLVHHYHKPEFGKPAWTCTCPHWQMRLKEKHQLCKHAIAVHSSECTKRKTDELFNDKVGSMARDLQRDIIL